MKNLKFLWFLFSIAFLTWSCEGKFDEPNNPLTANAGEEQEITTGAMAVLDGSKSTNAAGKPMEYSWKLLEKPTGANPTLSVLNSIAVQFTTDTEGAYTFELTVSYNAWTDKAEVTIVVSEGDENFLEARGGDDQSQNLGTMIQLDGTLSLNETGEDLIFLWEFVSKPEGSTVQFSPSNAGITNFQPDKPGEYLIKMTIKAGNHQSSDLIKVTILDGVNGEGPVILNSDILADKMLPDVFVNNPEKLDYLVTKDIAVKGAKLTVDPGVRIGFEEGTGFTIDANGSLRVYTMDVTNKPIIFQGKEANKGFWDGITIFSTQAPEYIVGLELRDAGKLGYGIKYTNGSKAHLNRTTVHNNLGVGIWLDESSSLEEFKYNHLHDNEVSPLKIPARLISELFIENQILDKNIHVTEGKILSGLEHIWPNFTVGFDILTDLVVYNGSSLVLSEGARINMNDDKAIRVINGSVLKILGSNTVPVKIEGISKQKGAWRGIYIENSKDRPSSIYLTEIRHAGSNAIAGQTPATIKLGNGAKFKLYKTVLDQGKGDGFEAVGSNIGLAFEENKIINHTGHPVSVAADLVEHLDYLTQMENNGINEVAVDGFKTLAKDGGEIVWKGFATRTPYVIKGLGKDLTIQSGMRIKDGVTIKMQPGSRIDVQNANGRLGYLTVEGFEGNPVIIQGTTESAGSWYGITYSTSNQQNVIRHALIKHAGKTMSNNFSAAVTVDNVPQGSLMVQNTKITHSGQHGIAVTKQFAHLLLASDLSFEEIKGEQIFTW
ncbi:PKD domain-containing protein [Algoriphagus yeomjeoni]|uniref:Right handed beta helix region n=2 Tax=Cyclobacteriaceae TaxID=563798 RepID=A0A327P375_9BACT|nr:hypothetical protein [Algoriphagus yeomjeoni]RAI84396.1 Right handed beta helix region [Algoriphagus yeomjeoni]